MIWNQLSKYIEEMLKLPQDMEDGKVKSNMDLEWQASANRIAPAAVARKWPCAKVALSILPEFSLEMARAPSPEVGLEYQSKPGSSSQPEISSMR